MSVTTTTKLLLVKPTPGTNEDVNRATMNGDYDKIDDAVGAKICTSSTRPTGSDAWVGRIIRETDTGFMYVCVVAGSPGPATWRQILADNSAGFVADDQLIVVERVGAAAALRLRRQGDSNQRLEVNSDGVMTWGSGSGAGDTNLFRDSANLLRTNDGLRVDGNLDVRGVGGKLYARKTADTSRNNTTSITDDPHLLVSVPANTGFWWVEASIAWTAHANADMQFGVTVPSGATFNRWRAVGNSTASTHVNIGANATSTIFQAGTTGTDFPFLISGYLAMGANTGNFAIRWGPNASVVDNATLYNGSMLRLERIA